MDFVPILATPHPTLAGSRLLSVYRGLTTSVHRPRWTDAIARLTTQPGFALQAWPWLFTPVQHQQRCPVTGRVGGVTAEDVLRELCGQHPFGM